MKLINPLLLKGQKMLLKISIMPKKNVKSKCTLGHVSKTGKIK